MRTFSASVGALTDAFVRALALFALINILAGLVAPKLDANWLWVQGGALPSVAVTLLVAAFALNTLVVRYLHPVGRRLARPLGILLAVACTADAVAYYRLLAAGRIHTRLPIPLTLLIALLLLMWVATRAGERPSFRSQSRRALWIRVGSQAMPVLAAGVLVLLEILTFGATDYRRDADAAVVFGAAVWADGRPSLALYDRTRTACDLYHQGLVDTLVFSGGRDPAAPRSEPDCMAAIARDLGVPDEAIVLDHDGRNTRASIRRAMELVADRGWQRVLMVSHDYHLARIHLLSRRAGLPSATVPARESRPMWKKPWFVTREVAAWTA